MNVIEYSSNQAKEITELFYESVHAVDSTVYSNEQKHAWAPKPIDYEKWKARLDKTRPYTLVIGTEIAGFIELELNGHIDCAYVSPKFQRKGVATNLLNHVIFVAKKAGLSQLYVEASTVAKPFFEKNAFQVESKNQVIRQGVVLVNYSMRVDI